MANPVFEIDTKGTCLFCINPNCGPVDKTNFDLTTATAIKMLFRYLNIDVRKVASASSSDSNQILLDESRNLSVTLCDSCFFLVDEFLELFQDFERIRLQLERCTSTLQEFMEKGNKDEDRVREYRRRRLSNCDVDPQLRFSEQLRKETFEKCSEAHSLSIPRICLRRGATCSMRKSADTDGPNNIEPAMQIDGGILEDSVQIKVEWESPNVNASSWNDCDDKDNDASSTTSEQELVPYPTIIKEEEIPDSDNNSDAIPTDPLSVPEEVRSTTKSKCAKCNKWFSSSSCRNRHIRAVHLGIKGPSRNKNLKCVYCSLSVTQRAGLIKHQYARHPMQMLSKVLPAGTSELDLNTALEDIVAMNWGFSGSSTATSHRHLTCPLCGQVRSASSRVRAHILQSHQDEVCRRIQICDKSSEQTSASGSFAFSATLPGSKIHTKFTNVSVVPCDICGKKFRCRKYVKDHKARVHFPKVVRAKAFKCNICDKPFLTKFAMQRHQHAFHPKILLLGKTQNENSTITSR